MLLDGLSSVKSTASKNDNFQFVAGQYLHKNPGLHRKFKNEKNMNEKT